MPAEMAARPTSFRPSSRWRSDLIARSRRIITIRTSSRARSSWRSPGSGPRPRRGALSDQPRSRRSARPSLIHDEAELQLVVLDVPVPSTTPFVASILSRCAGHLELDRAVVARAVDLTTIVGARAGREDLRDLDARRAAPRSAGWCECASRCRGSGPSVALLDGVHLDVGDVQARRWSRGGRRPLKLTPEVPTYVWWVHLRAPCGSRPRAPAWAIRLLQRRALGEDVDGNSLLLSKEHLHLHPLDRDGLIAPRNSDDATWEGEAELLRSSAMTRR